MDKKLFGILAVTLLLGAGCTPTAETSINPEDAANDTGAPTNSTETMLADEGASGMDVEVDISGDMVGGDAVVTISDVKEFTVIGGNFVFSPETMTVKKGDTVRVTFRNDEGFHDFVLDEFDVATKQIKGGEEEVVEFVADEVGSFEYYCSVGQHRQMGMKGTLIVTE